MIKSELHEKYSYLFEEELLDEIEKVGVFKHVPEGEQLMDIGETIFYMPLLLSGAIKIMREDTDGEDLILYFIETGDTCAMTLSCCMGNKKSEIRAIAETDTELIMIPIKKMADWMGKYKSWQNFILQSYQDRLKELLEAIDTIAFLKMDERLLKYLRDKAMVNHDDTIKVTHQNIADDLHTSRVVVSRLLKSLENQSKIKLHRNSITIVDM
ncbi:MAG: Crp/Fnr family transcriptional regulator [Mangrovimonas sp.]|nr:Crp/Fnr family transcriptional regulator [Mangrovimonas sp.]MCB0432163.1 Crp/Fnr family transcriptional regulator [Mangrovimonas sp.]MCB0435213.1 Crp/Fnr family transcriptional regulator [Mangrovimonas sp.]MCB0470108.1 Crp/Fnr family transcriptional regulator [Flavobacteriaceae bacterium]